MRNNIVIAVYVAVIILIAVIITIAVAGIIGVGIIIAGSGIVIAVAGVYRFTGGWAWPLTTTLQLAVWPSELVTETLWFTEDVVVLV